MDMGINMVENQAEATKSLSEMIGEAYDEQLEKDSQLEGPDLNVEDGVPELEAKQAEGESDDSEIEEVSQSEEEDANDSDEPEATDLPPIIPPVSWNAQDKELFKELPRNVQEIIKRRENERDSFVTKTREEYTQAGNELQRYKQALSPAQQRIKLQGLNEEQYISQLIAADELLQTTPAQGIKWLMQQYGLDPSQLNGQGTAPQADSPVNARIAQLEAMIAQQQQMQQQSQQLQAQHAQVQAEKDFHDFALEADGNGNLVHPYVADIGQDMIPFAASIRQQNPTLSNKEILKEAYERAVWANPDTREALIQSRQNGLQKKQRDEAAKKAARAKRVGSSINGAPSRNAAPVENQSKTLRASIEAAFDELTT